MKSQNKLKDTTEGTSPPMLLEVVLFTIEYQFCGRKLLQLRVLFEEELVAYSKVKENTPSCTRLNLGKGVKFIITLAPPLRNTTSDAAINTGAGGDPMEF